MDALISIVILIMILGTVSATSESLRSEINSVIGWYERTNIADNMLEVLTKTPGEPEEWDKNIFLTRIPGLSSPSDHGIIKYSKLKTFVDSFSNPQIVSSLWRLSLGKDFMMGIYTTNFTIRVIGNPPKIYLQNYTFGTENPSGGANFKIESAVNPGRDFEVEDIFLRKNNGNEYNASTICLIAGSNRQIDLTTGDYLRVVTNESVSIDDTKDNIPPIIVPPETVIEIYVVEEVSNLKINFDTCPWVLKITGQGQVVVTVSAYDLPPSIELIQEYPYALWDKNLPTYLLAIINGTVVTDQATIENSIKRAPWVYSSQTTSTMERMEYNVPWNPSKGKTVVYGVTKYQIPDYFTVQFQAPPVHGNVSVVFAIGSGRGMIFVYRSSDTDNLNATVVWYPPGGTYANVYRVSGDYATIKIELPRFVGSIDPESFFGMWVNSVSDTWEVPTLEATTIPDISPYLEPKREPILIYLKLWDEG